MQNAHDFRQLTPVTFLERCGRYFPHRIAVRMQSRDISFGELLQRSRWLAGAIRHMGLGKCAKIAIISHNSLAAIEAHFGIPGAGCVIVAINPWLAEAEIEKQLCFADVSAVIVSSDLMRSLDVMLRRNFNEESILVFEQKVTGSEFRLDYRTPEGMPLMAVNISSLEDTVVDENDPIAINFTSGTTGAPKGVIYSHRAAYLHALGLVLMVGLSGESVYFWSLPIFHVNGWGFMWAAAAVAAQQSLREDLREFSSKTLYESVLGCSATHLAGAPRLIRLLMDDEKYICAFSGLTVLTGGAAPTPDLIQKMGNAGIELIHQYGLNECLGPFVVCEPQESWHKLDENSQIARRLRQGIPAVHAGVGLRVVNSDGDDVPWNGETFGEIILSANTVAKEYFNNPEATSTAFIDGWFHTGDIAVVNSDGYLEIKDRRKDLIHVETVYGWENISSIEIENIISRFDGVKDVAVIGMRDEKGTPKIAAFVETKFGSLDEVMLRLHCEKLLPIFKVPNLFIEASIPKTATGKIKKNILEMRLANSAL